MEKEIDWEQRRYEIAKDVLVTLVGDRDAVKQYHRDPKYKEFGTVGDVLSLAAVSYADKLIDKLTNYAKDDEVQEGR